MTEGLWRTATVPNDSAMRLMLRHGLPRRMAKWAHLYGLDEESFLTFIEPERMEWSSPFRFHDMARAVLRIQDAMKQGQQIAVVGDYDVDGVTASVILCETLKDLGAAWHCILPHRVLDGYGLSTDIVDRAAKLDAKLIVTVDNGISATAAVSYAKQCGIDVIVTDHHAPSELLPVDAFALVHWLKSDDSDASRRLSGAGVSLKLACALRTTVGAVPPEPENWLLGLAAMAALADMMPMVGENRKLIRLGLAALALEQRPGWRSLCDRAQVDQSRLTEQSMLWNLTPRLNAAGRMDSADLAFQLLMTDDGAVAEALADRIEHLNLLRRTQTEQATSEALTYCSHGGSEQAGVVVYGAWSLGVVGIVAAKLAETLGRPAIVLADDGSNLLKGSGRAPEGFSLHHAVTACADWLHHFGGHDSAIGCAVERHQVEGFRAAFSQVCAAMESVPAEEGDGLQDVSIRSPLSFDWLRLDEANPTLLSWLHRFRPFGPEVPEPTFFLGPLTLQSIDRFSEGRHLRLKVKEDEHFAELVWFRVPPEAGQLSPGSQVAAVVAIEENHWRGRTSIQLRVQRLLLLRQPVTRGEFAEVYVALRRMGGASSEHLQAALPHRTVEDLEMIMATFVELGFAGRDDSAYHVVKQAPSSDLRESIHYQTHLLSQACLFKKGE